MECVKTNMNRWRWAFGAIVGAVVFANFAGVSSAQNAVLSGSLRVVLPGTDVNLNHGGSETEYGLALPGHARCPGDSRHSYFVWGYALPTSVKPAEVTFNQLLPVQGYDLYYEDSREPWGPVITRPFTGEVPDLPNNFSWARLSAELLIGVGQQSSNWSMSIACAYRGQITNYWTATVTFSRATKDPHGFTWKLQNEAPGSSGFPWGVATPIGAAIVLGLISFALYRRQHGDVTTSTTTNDSKAEIHV